MIKKNKTFTATLLGCTIFFMNGFAGNFIQSSLPKICLPCHGGKLKNLSEREKSDLIKLTPLWQFDGTKSIQRSFPFSSISAMFLFIDKVAATAEKQGHHPNFYIKRKLLKLQLYTYAKNELSENDFILANHIDVAWEENEKEISLIKLEDDKPDDCCVACNWNDSENDNEDELERKRKYLQPCTEKKSLFSTAWTIERNRCYAWFDCKTFPSAIEKLKKVIEYLSSHGFYSYYIYLSYNNLRIEMKQKQLTNENKNSKILSFAQEIEKICTI